MGRSGTDLASIGTLFAFVVVCAGVLFKDKEFRGSGTRYVPYINSQFILPVLLFIVGFLFVYLSGVSAVNSASAPGKDELRISTETLSVIEGDNPNSVARRRNQPVNDRRSRVAGMTSWGISPERKTTRHPPVGNTS